ncbi:hypothetical protein Tco_1074351 [Tanacetum coccineum]
MKSQQRYSSNLSFPYLVVNLCPHDVHCYSHSHLISSKGRNTLLLGSHSKEMEFEDTSTRIHMPVIEPCILVVLKGSFDPVSSFIRRTAELRISEIVPTPPGLPRQPAILVLLANRRRFHSSSSSSSPRKRRRASPYSSSSATYSSSSVSVGPSHKRCRSPTADSPFIRADMFPPRKRLRDPSSTYCHEVSVEVSTEMDIKDSIKAGVEGDIKRDTEDSHESNTELDTNSGILPDIEADNAAEAATAIAADTATNVVAAVKGVGDNEEEDDAEFSAKGTVEIRVDVVTEPEVPDDIPVHTIVESGSRETFKIGLDVVIQQLYDHMIEFPA